MLGTCYNTTLVWFLTGLVSLAPRGLTRIFQGVEVEMWNAVRTEQGEESRDASSVLLVRFSLAAHRVIRLELIKNISYHHTGIIT